MWHNKFLKSASDAEEIPVWVWKKTQFITQLGRKHFQTFTLVEFSESLPEKASPARTSVSSVMLVCKLLSIGSVLW